MLSRALVVLCVGFAAASVCSQQEGECSTSNPVPAVSLLALNSVVEPKVLKLAEEGSAGSSTAAQSRADLHAATSENWRNAWETANHALRTVKQQESLILLDQTPGEEHATNASRYDEELGEVDNATICRACAGAEQGLIDALTTAREGHITAQNLAVALAAASKGHETAVGTFSAQQTDFEEAKKQLESMLASKAYTSSKTEFDAMVSKAQSLHPAAELAWQAHLDRDADKKIMDDAQTEYNHAAEAALLLDADVAVKRRAEEVTCASLGLAPAPAPLPEGPQQCSNKADCLSKGWKLMWTGGEDKKILPLGESTMIGYMMPNGELLHAWHFKTPVSWKAEHPLDLFYDITPDLEVTRLSDGLKYTGDLVTSYGNYGGGCECGRGGGSWGRICLRRPDGAIGCGKTETRVPAEIDFPYLRAYGGGTCADCVCGLSHYNWNAGPNSCGNNNAEIVILTTEVQSPSKSQLVGGWALYQGCLGSPRGWSRPGGNVPISAAGAKSCNDICKGHGYKHFGMECPMGGDVHCQCSNAPESGDLKDDSYCDGRGDPLVHSHSHCVGPYSAEGFLFGDYIVGSVYGVV